MLAIQDVPKMTKNLLELSLFTVTSTTIEGACSRLTDFDRTFEHPQFFVTTPFRYEILAI